MINRVLIVGHGSIGKRHLRVVRNSLPAALIMVLRHKAYPETPEFADYCTSSFEEAISFSPQVAIIANPSTMHSVVACRLASVGCHLLIEKPITANRSDAQLIVDTIRLARVKCLIGYNLRYLSSLQEFKQLVQEGFVGKPLAVRCEVGQYLPSWRPETDYRNGVSARNELGGGVLLELSHELDYLRWIFGDVEWLSAWIGNVSDLEIDVEDTAHLTLGFSNHDITGKFVASVSMDFVRHDTVRTCILIGSEGSLRWNGVSNTVDILKAGNSSWTQIFQCDTGRDESYRLQWEHFLACIENDLTPFVDAESGMAIVSIIEAAKQSSNNNCHKVVLKN